MVGPATAEALVDAAEALFAEDGFEGASLRAVMRAAGSDPGAVHYHFRGRQGLAAAVLDRVLGPLNTRRLELLATAEAESINPGPVPLDRLVEAIVRPDIEVATGLDERDRGRARLVGAIYINPASFVSERVEQHFGPVAERFMPHLVAAAPHVPPDLLSWRIRWSVFGVVGALLSDPDEPFLVEPEELIDRLVATGAAAVAAPAQ